MQSFFLILETNFISEDPFCIILAPAPNGDFRPDELRSRKDFHLIKLSDDGEFA